MAFDFDEIINRRIPGDIKYMPVIIRFPTRNMTALSVNGNESSFNGQSKLNGL